MLKALLSAIKRKDLWVYMSWYDIIARYRRTTLGPFWVTIITAISIFSLAIFGSILFKVNFKELLPYVACGMVVWGYISTIITDTCTVFLTQAGLIQNIKLPLFVFPLRLFLRNTLLFLHSLIILFIILAFNSKLSIHLVFLVPAFFIFAINTISLCIILGFFATRYRDVIHIVQALLSILVFLTPMMWRVEMLGKYAYMANMNPFTHFIALLRNPLLGIEISNFSLQYVGAVTLLGFLLAQHLYYKLHDRLVFWL